MAVVEIKTAGIYLMRFPNGKSYVGQSVDLRTRINKHFYNATYRPSKGRPKQVVDRAIAKHGFTRDSVEILEEFDCGCITQEDLDTMEKFYITEYDSFHPNGYNFTDGGGNGKPSEESRRKNSESNRGKVVSERTGRRISRSLAGRKHSAEHVENQRIAQTGMKRSPETRQRIREAALKREANRRMGITSQVATGNTTG